jgi:hypothetical protein
MVEGGLSYVYRTGWKDGPHVYEELESDLKKIEGLILLNFSEDYNSISDYRFSITIQIDASTSKDEIEKELKKYDFRIEN